MKISKEWVESYFAHGIDVANRRIFLWGDIDEESVSSVVKGIYYLEAEDGDKPIDLYISSLGGDVDEMFGLYDILNTVTCPIKTCAFGKCMSAAPLLVAAGTKGKRFATPNCAFMVHEGNVTMPRDRADAVRHTVKQLDRDRTLWAELMEANTKKTAKFWLNKVKNVGDAYFDTDTAIDYGLIDYKWSEK